MLMQVVRKAIESKNFCDTSHREEQDDVHGRDGREVRLLDWIVMTRARRGKIKSLSREKKDKNTLASAGQVLKLCRSYQDTTGRWIRHVTWTSGRSCCRKSQGVSASTPTVRMPFIA